MAHSGAGALVILAELFAGSVEEDFGGKTCGEFGMRLVEQALADKEVAGGFVQQFDSEVFDHRVTGWVGIDAGPVPGDKAGNVEFLAGKHCSVTDDAVVGADQVAAAHLPAHTVQAPHEGSRRLVEQAVHDGVGPSAPEPGDVDFHAVGFDFVGAVRHSRGVAQEAHQPAVIDLQHVHIYLVVSYLLQVLHAIDDGIEHA